MATSSTFLYLYQDSYGCKTSTSSLIPDILPVIQTVIQDLNKKHQKLQKLEISNNDLTIAYQQSQEKLRKTQEKLDEESRVKMVRFVI